MQKNIVFFYTTKKIIIGKHTIENEKNTFVYTNFTEKDIANCIAQITTSTIETMLIETTNPEEILSLFKKNIHTITAGGGIVKNSKEETLMIFRNGYWDLPKGKLEENEDIATCAFREVQEETGIENLQIQDKIGSCFHIYFWKEIWVLKETVWYNMLSNDIHFTPQSEEGIDIVKWVNIAEMPTILQNTYGNIVALLQQD